MFLHKKFITLLLKNGKKSKSLIIYFYFLKLLKLFTKKDPYLIVANALNNVTCYISFQKKIISGKLREIPIWNNSIQSRTNLALKWLINCSKKQGRKSMILNLVAEFMQAAKGQGYACKKKKEMYMLALQNKKYIHWIQKKKKKK